MRSYSEDPWQKNLQFRRSPSLEEGKEPEAPETIKLPVI
jgi:hypothetical protein